MTDKQIKIDGVDVSGCCAFSKHREGYCGWYTLCEGDSCSYKLDWALDQLKAKEQECEELKAEQAEIKKYLGISHKTILERLEELTEFRDRDRDEIWQLTQTLTEIKEIAEHCMKQDICTTCDNSDKCHIEDEEIPTYDVCKLILQKISECEGNDD